MSTTPMSTEPPPAMDDGRLAAVIRQHEVEQFLFAEAALLDEHRYEQWLELFAEDATYFMPLRRTVLARERDREFTRPGEMAFFDDTKPLLAGRVAKLLTGRSWAEDPPSRTRRLVTNVRVLEDDGTELAVSSNFLLYRSRLNTDEDTWVGSRRDVLRRADGSFSIAARTIHLDQTVLLARNLSNFF